jgi:predicted amidophosphoribosyltransferase
MREPAKPSQSCPVCDRPLNLSPKFLGCPLICAHCGGEFTAHGLWRDENQMADEPILGRADAMLERVRLYLDDHPLG